MVIKNILSELCVPSDISLARTPSCWHSACSCTSGATYAIVTRVCSNYISSAEIKHGEKHYLGPLRQMKRESKRLLVEFFKSFTT